MATGPQLVLRDRFAHRQSRRIGGRASARLPDHHQTPTHRGAWHRVANERSSSLAHRARADRIEPCCSCCGDGQALARKVSAEARRVKIHAPQAEVVDAESIFERELTPQRFLANTGDLCTKPLGLAMRCCRTNVLNCRRSVQRHFSFRCGVCFRCDSVVSIGTLSVPRIDIDGRPMSGQRLVGHIALVAGGPKF